MKRSAWLFAALALLVLVVLAAAVAWFAWGPRGVATRLLARIDITARIAGLEVSTTRGPHGKRVVLTATGVVLRAQDWDLHADRIRLTVSTDDLLSAQLRIPDALIQGGVVDVHPSNSHRTTPLQLPQIHVGVLRAPSAVVVVAGVALTIDNLRTALHTRGTVLSLDDVSLALSTLRRPAAPAPANRAAIAQLAGRIALDFQVPLQIRSALQVTREDSAGRIVIAGTADNLLAQLNVSDPLQQRFDLQLVERNAVWHLLAGTRAWAIGDLTLTSAAADLTLRGTPQPLTLTASYADQRLGDVKLALRGTLDREVVRLTGTVDAAATQVGVRAEARLTPWRVVADFDGRDVDIAHVFPDTPSRLHVTGRLVASADTSDGGGPMQATLTAAANGTLLARRINASVDARWTRAGTQLVNATLDAPGNQLRAAGNWRDGVKFSAELTRLEQLSPQLAGRVSGHGMVSARGYTLDLHGRGVRFGTGLAVAQLDATGSGNASRLNLDLRATALRLPNTPPTDLQATAAGATADHALQLTARNRLGQLDLGGRGTFADRQWRIRLTRAATALTGGNGTWSNSTPVLMRVTQGEATLDGCIAGPGAASICIEGGRARGAQVYGTARAQGLRLRQLPLPQAVAERVSGVLGVDARATGGSVDLQAAITGGEVRGSREPIAFTARATAHVPLLTNEPWRAAATAEGTAFGTVTAGGTRTQDGRINGRVRGNVPDLGSVQTLFMSTDQVLLRGPASLDLQVTGRDDAPLFTGTGNMRGTVRLPALVSAPMPLKIDLQGQSSLVAVHSELQAGDGMVRADGELRFAPGDWRPTLSLKVTGANAHLLNHTDLSAFVAPDLNVSVTSQRVVIDGRVVIERADIRFSATEGLDNGLSGDVVIHRPGATGSAVADAPIPLQADVQIVLGERVRFTAAGLDTRLSGAVQLTATPARPLRLLGHVDAVDGTFAAYGVKLAIEHGRLDFDGPVDNPQVNVRAVRPLAEDNNDKVGVIVTGPLQRLNTQLFSEPPRTQTAALAYLITGKPMDLASGSEIAKVNGAGIALGVVGLLPQTQQIRAQLGLDELEVRDAISQGDSAIVIGKQITPRLRARYVYSVFNRSGGVQLRYRITDNITLQTEAGAQTQAVDVLWEWPSKHVVRKPKSGAAPSR